MAKASAAQSPKLIDPVNLWKQDRSEAIHLAKRLVKDLPVIIRELQTANGDRPLARVLLKRRRFELQQAALEIAGFGATEEGRDRATGARYGALLVIVVQKFAENYWEASAELAKGLPDPNSSPAPRYPDAYPLNFRTALQAQLDGLLEIVPSFARKMDSRYDDALKNLVLASAVRSRALARRKTRSNYLKYVVGALKAGGITRPMNLAALEKQVGRYIR